ncbi:DUF2510 domain-containing protein [Microbacterium sp. NPDC087591]|uniref:DUF2510 domain-containing protein n=1 Tax=Microbacterium sp. NPDC087591 TaxID=3364192 RepID=UPI0038252AE9
MTTPAGWYDDGSGNRRWWDGDQWTEHVVVAPHPPAATAAEVEVTPEPVTPPFAAPFELPSATPAHASSPGSSPGAYPGAYVGGAYPDAHPAFSPQQTPPRQMSVLGLIGLVAAVVGVVLACIPPLALIGWVVLGLAFIACIVSLFLPQAKWPGITGIGVSVLGAIVAGSIALVTLGINSIAEAGETGSWPGDRAPSEDSASGDPADIEGAEMVPFDELAVGDCLPFVDYTGDDPIFELPVVPCDLPHTDEVYFIYQLDDGEFPGDDTLFEGAWDGCVAQFESFTGIAYEDSVLDFYSYQPTEYSWTRANDRTVQCIIFSYEDVTGTLRNARY